MRLLIALVTVLVAACSGATTTTELQPPQLLVSVDTVGGCFRAGNCPRLDVYSDGRVVLQQKSWEAVESTQFDVIDPELANDAVDAFRDRDLDELAEAAVVDCRAPVDGIDVMLSLPTLDGLLSCVSLSALADEVPELAELFDAMAEALDPAVTPLLVLGR